MMNCKTIPLTLDYAKLGMEAPQMDAYIEAYIIENSPEIEPDRCRGAVVICPGGGYSRTSDREAEPIALQFLAEDYHVFVLRYSVKPTRFPCALLQLSQTLCMLRRNAKQWHIDTDKIAVCGFSSGGHLTASLGAFWNQPFVQNALDIKNDENKPNALILGYPVISGGEHAHVGSFQVLTGKEQPETKELDALSIEKQVTPSFPKTFIWHTAADAGVPVENSLLLSLALRENKVPFELHIYPYGRHGLSLANKSTAPNEQYIEPYVAPWMKHAICFLNKIGFDNQN